MSDPLSTYLHDHLDGAKAALDLLEAMRDGHKDAALKDFAAYLLMEVQAATPGGTSWQWFRYVKGVQRLVR